MKNYWNMLLVLALPLVSLASHAEPVNVKSLHYSTTPKQNRLLFDVTASPKHRVFAMDNPSRLVIDIEDAQLIHALVQPDANHPLFARVRNGVKNNTGLRIVIDLKAPITPKKFSLTTSKSDDRRLIVDLFNKTPIVASNIEIPKPIKTVDNKDDADALKPVNNLQKTTRIVVAIDPGHGGNDPGAHGPNGTEEKQVTLAIAKKLANLINGQSGMKAIMVRKGDYYVGLRERMQIARAAKADLFISIHADAFKDVSIKGASIYTLSTGAASSEAAHWLADSENASDLVGVSLNDKDETLATVLLDLSQTATQEASVNVANQVLKSFNNVAQLHKDSVQKAGFIVLKSPDIPSILVETAFISNPSEEQNLVNTRFQDKMATAMFKGVRNYFSQSLPRDDKIAALTQ